jgi:hypothetical protein
MSLRGMKSNVPQEGNPQSSEIASLRLAMTILTARPDPAHN